MGLVMTPSPVLGEELKEVMSRFRAHSDGYCHLYYVSLWPSCWDHSEVIMAVVLQIPSHSTATESLPIALFDHCGQ